ncbi:MAG: hydroxymethylglutaryl-CoA synthase family protein [Lactobacillaceae bacterium]
MIGISKITGYFPQRYVKMRDLAVARREDPQKYLIGLGQEKMAVVGGNEDAVSLGLNAVKRLITDLDDREKSQIKMVIWATESSTDESKAASLNLIDTLQLPDNGRYFEIKEACYGGTAALALAFAQVALHPETKIIVVTSDIARYGLKTKGEVTQGAGSIAMMVEDSSNIALSPFGQPAYYAKNIADFYRPQGQNAAIVQGQLSNQSYLNFFYQVFQDFFKKQDLIPEEIKLINFHLPYTKIGLKGLEKVKDQVSLSTYEEWVKLFNQGKALNAEIGNIYTGSLYLNLISNMLQGNFSSGDLLGMYSYGSGAQGEFYVLKVQQVLKIPEIENLFINRKAISVEEYENLYRETTTNLNQTFNSEGIRQGDFYLKFIKNGERFYEQA